MLNADFYILGPHDGDDITFWNIDKGWVTDFALGTPFTGEILTLPLPEGSVCVIPFSSASEPLAQYNPLPGGGAVENFFQKTY
jgi:hypothetical protein